MLLPALKDPALGRAVANDGELLVDVSAHSLSVRSLGRIFATSLGHLAGRLYIFKIFRARADLGFERIAARPANCRNKSSGTHLLSGWHPINNTGLMSLESSTEAAGDGEAPTGGFTNTSGRLSPFYTTPCSLPKAALWSQVAWHALPSTRPTTSFLFTLQEFWLTTFSAVGSM